MGISEPPKHFYTRKIANSHHTPTTGHTQNRSRVTHVCSRSLSLASRLSLPRLRPARDMLRAPVARVYAHTAVPDSHKDSPYLCPNNVHEQRIRDGTHTPETHRTRTRPSRRQIGNATNKHKSTEATTAPVRSAPAQSCARAHPSEEPSYYISCGVRSGILAASATAPRLEHVDGGGDRSGGGACCQACVSTRSGRGSQAHASMVRSARPGRSGAGAPHALEHD